jgi:Zn-finger nucleic acid-binding protein
MNCAGCGAAMRLGDEDGHFTCVFCGRVHVPEVNADGVRVLGDRTGEACPLCSAALVHAVVAGARVHHCTACRGLLIPAEAFLIVTEHLRARRTDPPPGPRALCEQELERRLFCPRCRNAMHTHPYAGAGNFVIDNCPRCRLNWLDHGELRRAGSAPDPQYTAVE